MISGIGDRATFTALRRTNHVARSSDLRLRYLPTAHDRRFAFAIPKAVGSAVTRNRIRRRLKHAITDWYDLEPNVAGLVALIIVHRGAGERSFSELEGQIHHLLRTAHGVVVADVSDSRT